ncbi:related to Meiotic activator RIM4 [Zygosaccharomyces bailii]|nr:related to Meiotic activator RIM4 [Zygosaccharomyces bailii]
MTIASVMDPVAGAEHPSMDTEMGGAIQHSKGDTIISEDIGQLLPTEVSSAESDNFDDDEENEVDNENENLLDDITEEDIQQSVAIELNSQSPSHPEDQNVQKQEQLLPTDHEKDTPVGVECNATASKQHEHATDNKPSTSSAIAERNSKKDDSASTSFRGRPSSCVFVASLAAALSDDELCISVTQSFKQYGQLARVKVLRDPANRPYAFVQYTNDKDAKRALKMARGSVLNGRTLRCESARVNRTLFVTHVTPIYFVEVANLCEAFGELEQLVPSNDNNQLSRRCTYPPSNNNSWFVQFAYRDDAIRAFANLRTTSSWDVEWVQNIEVPKYFNLLNKRKDNNKSTDSRFNIKNATTSNSDTKNDGEKNGDHSEGDDNDSDSDDNDEDYEDGDESEAGSSYSNEKNYSHGRGEDNMGRKSVGSSRMDDNVLIDKHSIFVGQLDQSVTKERLHERFSTHGSISDINLISKINKVFAFIQFETEEAAAAALERENHAIFLNKTMHVQYKEIGGHRGRRQFRKNSNGNGFYGTGSGRNGGGSGRMFTGPQVNLAPPPINMYRRRSQQGDSLACSYMGPPMAGPTTDFEMNYVPYMNGQFRRKSFANGWSSSRSHSMKSEIDTICGDGATDATSEASESAGQTNSATTYNNSSAGSMGHTTTTNASNNNSGNQTSHGNHHNNSGSNGNGANNHFNGSGSKKRYGKRGNNGGFNDAPKPYYFQPYYYHPMHYPMGPMGPVAPAHPSQAPGGNHPYMMIYPMPPPPPSGVDGNLLAQNLPVGLPGSVLHGSPPSAQSQGMHCDSNEFTPNAKPCQLDY